MEAQKLRGLKGKELIRLESRARIVGLLSLASLAAAQVFGPLELSRGSAKGRSSLGDFASRHERFIHV